MFSLRTLFMVIAIACAILGSRASYHAGEKEGRRKECKRIQDAGVILTPGQMGVCFHGVDLKGQQCMIFVDTAPDKNGDYNWRYSYPKREQWEKAYDDWWDSLETHF